MRVDIFSHSFMVSELSERQKQVVTAFSRGLVSYKKANDNGIMRNVMDKVWASAFDDRRFYRFHINLLNDFRKHVGYHQIASTEIQKNVHEIVMDDSFQVVHEVKEIRPLGGVGYEKQIELVEHIVSPGSNKILNLQAGAGKTLMAMHAMITLGLRTAIFMRGGLLSRWTPDLEKTFKLKRGELLVIRGGESLNAIMEMALENDIDQVKIFMISLDSYSDYIREFESKGVSAEYPIEPGKFFERLKVGFGILDEAHMNAHQVMKLFTYMHVNKFLSLSATLDTREAFKDRMYAVMFPREQRAGKDFYKVYIRAKCIKYQLHRPKAIRTTGFGGAYSHNAFEASLMTQKNKVALKNYIDLIGWAIDSHYVKVMKKGMKAIVFCGTVKMCTMLTKYFAKKYPHLDVRRYVSEDPAKNLQEAELIFSTVLSAGTGHDIPNLLVGIMTTAIDSQQSNEQTKGRTRPLKDFPDVDPWFLYFACSDIEKHMRYHYNKEKAFQNLVKSHSTEQAPITV